MIETTLIVTATDGQEYYIYDLPSGLTIKQDITISFWDPRTRGIPDLSNTDFQGTLILDGQLPQGREYDLSHINKLLLKETNLSHVGIQFNPNADTIRMRHVSGLKGDLVMDNVKNLYILYTDMSQVSLKPNPKANVIRIVYSHEQRKDKKNKLKPGDYDFSGVRYLVLGGCRNLNKSNVKYNPNGKEINILECGKMCGMYDFHAVEKLTIYYTDLEKAGIIFNPNGEVSLTGFGTNAPITAQWYANYLGKQYMNGVGAIRAYTKSLYNKHLKTL